MKKALGIVMCTLLVLLSATATMAGGNSATFSDVSGHWAEAAIVQAAQSGWVTGYPDGTFRPDGPVTRAEFVKMLLAMQGLTPDSLAARQLEAAAADAAAGEAPLSDVNGHWLQTQGWLPVALAAGTVDPADYAGQFQPDMPITRREVVVMLVRTIGRSGLAKQNETKGADLPFSDAAQVPLWAQSWLHEAVAADLVKGYPDGSFRPDASVTRAEAVVLVQRTNSFMESGADPTIRVYVKTADGQLIQVQLPHSVHVVDGNLMLPVQAVVDAGLNARGTTGATWFWQPMAQKLEVRKDHTGWAVFQVGQKYADYGYGGFMGVEPAALIDGLVYASMDVFHPQNGASYDPVTKTVVLPAFEPLPAPGPS